MQGLKTFTDVDMQQTSGEDSCHQICRVLKMDASVRVDSLVFMHNMPCGNTLLTAGSHGGGQTRRSAVHTRA